MKHFWQGFDKKGGSPIQFKKHTLMMFWRPAEETSQGMREEVKKLSLRYPSVKIKLINVKKDPTKPDKHGVKKFPTVLLLKDGREVGRFDERRGSPILLEQLFRKAHV